MRLVFAGTPEFACPTLAALLAAGHDVAAVYSQPGRPAGRGQRVRVSPVQAKAEAHGLPVHTPLSLKPAGEAEHLATLAPEALIVVAYGLLLPPAILAIPRLGCINVHASLLPRWRGAAPIARAIEAGDAETGVTIMQMEAGLDTGPMLARAATPLHADDNAETLHDRLARMGAELLIATLPALADGTLRPEPQDGHTACYAPKLHKGEARLDWGETAGHLLRRIRAYYPWPVAWTTLAGRTLRILAAERVDGAPSDARPGGVLLAGRGGITVQTGAGALLLTRVQPEGGKPMDAAAFLHGRPLAPGERLGA